MAPSVKRGGSRCPARKKRVHDSSLCLSLSLSVSRTPRGAYKARTRAAYFTRPSRDDPRLILESAGFLERAREAENGTMVPRA